MQFEFSNFGRIRQGGVDLGDLTIICGRNNSGKTYASYAIHSFLRNFESLARANVNAEKLGVLEKQGAVSFDLTPAFAARELAYKKASERFVSELHDYFSVDESFFAGASVTVAPPSWISEDALFKSSAAFTGGGYSGVKEVGSTELVVSVDKDRVQLPSSYSRNVLGGWIARAAVGYCLPTPFAITSERTGVSLFYKDLDLSRNRLFEKILQAGGKEVDLFDLVLKNSSRYALPVRENIDSVRAYESISKERSFLLEDESSGVIDSLDDLLGGGFSAEKESLSYTFKVKGVRKKQRVPIYVASSAVKSLLLLDLFVRHVATKGSMLIIDEPELNLHPANQRKIAGLLVRLVNAGVRVLVTTHSDFILREISARIALAAKRESVQLNQFMEHNQLGNSDLLDHSRVKAFAADGGDLRSVQITDAGIEIDSINDEIARANQFFEDVIFFES